MRNHLGTNQSFAASFNEAGAFLPRRLAKSWPMNQRKLLASMRPGHFYPGDRVLDAEQVRAARSFNEAGAFLPRRSFRRRDLKQIHMSRFNEAGAFLPRR